MKVSLYLISKFTGIKVECKSREKTRESRYKSSYLWSPDFNKGAKAIQCSKIEKKKKTYPYLTCKKEVYGDPHLTPHTLTSEGPELTQSLSATELLAFPTG